jgi:hypothetical protein
MYLFIPRRLFKTIILFVLLTTEILSKGLIPSGGEHYSPFSRINILWPTLAFSQNELINIYLVSENNITIIGNAKGSIGVYEWIIPSVPPGKYKVKVQSAYRPAIVIESDSYFTIDLHGNASGTSILSDIRVYGIQHTDFVRAEWSVTNSSQLRVRNIVNAELLLYEVTGRTEVNIDCSSVPSGIYMIDLQCDDGTILYAKMILVK